MKLVSEEQNIKEMIKHDRNNPEIYNRLQKMIYIFLHRKKSPGTRQEIEEVSYTMAGDIFLKIVNGVEINYLLGYFERWYKGYFRQYYEPEKYDVPYDPSKIDLSLRTYEGSQKYDEIVSKEYLRNISLVVNDVMERVCKYRYNSPAYINLKLSLLVTLRRGTIFSFHLTEEQTQYLKILRTAFYEEVRKEGFNFSTTIPVKGGSVA